ncbi:hypothetical protein MBANPS3_012210 [Mucor bainieri]
MSTINALSNELLLTIYNHIDSVAHLAQCRLITVKSEEQALKLYRHLFHDPRRTPLIKHLHFELDSTALSFVIEDLLRMVFTSNIEQLTGSVKADKFFNTLFDIGDQDPSQFNHLKSIPKYTGNDHVISNNRLLKFKSAVHSFKLTVDDTHRVGNRSWSTEFDQFPNLATFTLKGVPSLLQGIEKQIQLCHKLKTLNLVDINYSGQSMTRINKDQLIAWATRSVRKENSLRTVNVEALCRAELVEYLLYKYPNVTNITIKGELWFPTNNSLILDHDNLNRILDAVKNIQEKEITLILPADIKMKHVIEFAITREEDIGFNIKQINDQNQLVMEIN